MPAAVSCSLAPCAAQTDSVISDLWRNANIIFCPLASAQGTGAPACLLKPGRRLDLVVMLIEAIREFNRAVPFRPYEIRTNGGERLQVPHRDLQALANARPCRGIR